MMDEDNETIQFYKIKLMEKESEISELQANAKKVEFKHNRDIKDIRMSEEKAKQLLKQEKAKLDKSSKAAAEHQELNNMLLLRLAELREEKDKDIETVRNQYNAIKEQIRSYERILPTHTFLVDIGATIALLPTYEDLFLNLREKSAHCEELQQKLDASRIQTSEALRAVEANEESYRKRKEEVEKTAKQLIAKLQDSEGKMLQLRDNLQNLQGQLGDAQHLLQEKQRQIEQLKGSLQREEARVQLAERAHISDLQSKEEEIRALSAEEFDKYEAQLDSLRRRSEHKENLHILQINLLEEENASLQVQLHREKEKFQQNYYQIKEVIDNLRNELDQQLLLTAELTEQVGDRDERLTQSAAAYEQQRRQLAHFENELRSEKTELAKSTEILRANEQTAKKLNETTISLEEISERYQLLNQDSERLTEELRRMIELNAILANQLEEHKHKTSSKDALAEMSNEFVSIRRESLEEIFTDSRGSRRDSFPSYLQLTSLKQLKSQIEEESCNSGTIIVKEDDRPSGIKEKQQTVLSNVIQDLQAKLQQYMKQCAENTHKQQQQSNEIKLLKKQIQEKALAAEQSVTKEGLRKAQVEALQNEVNRLQSELKLERQAVRLVRQQLKDAKETNFSTLEKYTKDMKQLNIQNTLLRQEKEKLKSESAARQKSMNNDISSLKGTIQQLSKRNQSKEELLGECQNLKTEHAVMVQRLQQLSEQMEVMRRQLQSAEDQMSLKNREVDILTESLERQRKERTLIAVPSLQSIKLDDEESFKQQYNLAGQKESQIYLLERQVSDLKEQLEHIQSAFATERESLEAEQNVYIQEIITMKLKVAESEMRASEKEFLYSQLKKKMVKAK